MFNAARLRLAGWYLLILAVIVGLLSFALFRLLHQVQKADLRAARPNARHILANTFASDLVTLASQIIAVDMALLFLAALGAYILAGRTLRPIEEAVERQRRFASAASHELRTPLTALQGHVEVALLRQRTVPEYERILGGISNDIDRMSQLVRSLLVLARPESDATLANSELVNLADSITMVADLLEPLALSKSQTFAVTVPNSLTVAGDALMLRQVFTNLLENAITYTGTAGAIRLEARAERGNVILVVSDTGQGIAASDLPHIFEPFYQTDTARSNAAHVGLGLALAAWIVRAHGGSIEATSTPGVGSKFTVSLPLAP